MNAHRLTFFTVVVVLILVLAGCGKREPNPTAAPASLGDFPIGGDCE